MATSEISHGILFSLQLYFWSGPAWNLGGLLGPLGAMGAHAASNVPNDGAGYHLTKLYCIVLLGVGRQSRVSQIQCRVITNTAAREYKYKYNSKESAGDPLMPILPTVSLSTSLLSDGHICSASKKAFEIIRGSEFCENPTSLNALIPISKFLQFGYKRRTMSL